MKYFVTSRLSENISKTPEGFLLCLGVPIARTGEQVYGEGETPLEVGDDGTVVITRDESEVFRKETLASFEGKPITITHPEEFVDPENWSVLAKGVMQNVRRGDGKDSQSVLADILITDSMAIELVESGLREVSCGYEAEYVQTEKGRGKQINIIGNHLALVREGRAGPNFAIKDHKGVKKMGAKDRIKAIFSKAHDEAAKVLDESSEEKKEEKTSDVSSMDELLPMMKDMMGKMEKFMGAKDADPEAPAEGAMTALTKRLDALEQAVAKLLERESKEDEVPVSDEDAEEKKEEKAEDACDEDESETGVLVGDAASRIEILAPGSELKGKSAKEKALKAAYATKDGKKIIDRLSGGKPDFKSEALFMGASEILKIKRRDDLADTKRVTDSATDSGEMTPEKVNELNAKHYGLK